MYVFMFCVLMQPNIHPIVCFISETSDDDALTHHISNNPILLVVIIALSPSYRSRIATMIDSRRFSRCFSARFNSIAPL